MAPKGSYSLTDWIVVSVSESRRNRCKTLGANCKDSEAAAKSLHGTPYWMASEVRKLYFDRLGFGFGVKVQRNFGPDRKIIEAAAESLHGMSHWMAPEVGNYILTDWGLVLVSNCGRNRSLEVRKLYFDRLELCFDIQRLGAILGQIVRILRRPPRVCMGSPAGWHRR
jgi:hypothetical protein